MKEFKDKKIIITGGAQGIGLALVESFAEVGSEVIFIDKEKIKGQKLQRRFNRTNKKVFFYPCNLSDFAKSIKLFRKILKKHKNINFLINNAKAGKRNEVLKEKEKNWSESIDVILKNSFFFSQEFINLQNSNEGNFFSDTIPYYCVLELIIPYNYNRNLFSCQFISYIIIKS